MFAPVSFIVLPAVNPQTVINSLPSVGAHHLPTIVIRLTFHMSPQQFSKTQPVLVFFALKNANLIPFCCRIYFLPRPPCYMPLRVRACGQPDYWFLPSWSLPDDARFELVVESREGEVLYSFSCAWSRCLLTRFLCSGRILGATSVLLCLGLKCICPNG